MQQGSFWSPTLLIASTFKKMNTYLTHIGSVESVGIAYKRFAIRHGLLPEEVGKHESRTCNYKTDYPNKKRDQREARKAYGDPKKLTLWAAEQQGMKIKLKDFFK